MEILVEDPRNKYKRKHRQLGLCADCPFPIKPGHIYCEKHLQRNKERGVKKRIWRKNNRLCIKCSAPLHPDGDKGFSHCIFCRERTNSFLRKTER